MQPLHDDVLVDERRAAEILSIAPATLARWRYAGKPPAFLKVGRLCRYKLSELRRFLASAERTSTSDTGSA